MLPEKDKSSKFKCHTPLNLDQTLWNYFLHYMPLVEVLHCRWKVKLSIIFIVRLLVMPHFASKHYLTCDLDIWHLELKSALRVTRGMGNVHIYFGLFISLSWVRGLHGQADGQHRRTDGRTDIVQCIMRPAVGGPHNKTSAVVWNC